MNKIGIVLLLWMCCAMTVVSQNVVVASELLGDDARRLAFVQKLRDEQKVLRDKALEKKVAPLRSLDEARANKLELFK